MTFEEVLARAASGGADLQVLEELAAAALRDGEEERAIPMLRSEASRKGNARLWQWTGLLHRAVDEHGQALESFAKAAALAPVDASIAHGRARVALEAGIPAVELFQQALRLMPSDGDLLLGLAAAQFALGAGEQAEARLASLLERNPRWVQGHLQLAQLRSMLGKPGEASSSIEKAVRDHPADGQLWTALFDLRILSSNFQALDSTVTEARAAGQPEAALLPFEAVAASENGETERADRLFSALLPDARTSISIWEVRHLLRTGRIEEALPLIDEDLAGSGARAMWPYAETAWRMSGDDRWQWLTRDDRFIAVIDLTSALPEMGNLAALLRKLHLGMGQYLDQSVRGGTQTDGPLFSRVEPEIRTLRSAVVGAVKSYIASLPEPDAGHPLLAPRRDRPVRFSGSWSVRLRDGGNHANHVHPQGWISSAFYVALPGRSLADDPHAGWLTLGAPPDELGLHLPPVKAVEPREGQLVLFPSWMWHGTVKFGSGERLTAAFDVRAPN